MKTSFKSFVVGLFTLLGIISTNISKSQVSAGVSFSIFHDNLQTYGRWVSHARYGQVWIPNISGFRPYSTGGHWAYTDVGWTWVSDYDWGWAPFHYGRWAFDPSYGWVWVPGYEWGPAWVSWRTGDNYYGWAPLGPDINIGIGIAFGTTIAADNWVFVPSRYIASPDVYRYYTPRTRNVTIIKNTTIINNTRETNVFNRKAIVVGGPRREDVERVAHTNVRVMHISDASKPGRETVDRSRSTINVYRPVINKTTVNKKVVVNNTTVNKKATVNNHKVVNKTEARKPLHDKKTRKTTVNNDKRINKEKETSRITEKKVVNRTVANNKSNNKTVGSNADKQAGKNNKTLIVKPQKSTKEDAFARSTEAGKPRENKVEKQAVQKSVSERAVQKPDNQNASRHPSQRAQAEKKQRNEEKAGKK